MGGMVIDGERGDVFWTKSFGGLASQKTFDTCLVRFGLLIPFALGDVVHVWDIPQTKLGGPGRAIRLRPDPDFKRRVVTGNWIWLGTMIGFLGLFLTAAALLADMRFVPAAAAFAGAVVVGVAGFWLTRPPADEARHRAVRLLLGLHEWGGSDPATWSEELVAGVADPKAAFGAESFAALAERERAAGRWAEAMWAARLCAAAEDEAEGQALTDAILEEPEVAERLRRVRRRPQTRDEEFGPAPGLRKWLSGDPEDHIMAVG